MNHKEVAAEFMRDLTIIKDRTLPRLQTEYDRERKKLKINLLKEYPKVYSIKTKAKNNWLIFLRGSTLNHKYCGIHDIRHCCVTYYYEKRGLVVLREHKEGKWIELFWGHFFKRYNERLNLGLSQPIDAVKRYFINNPALFHKLHNEDNCQYSIGVSKEGFVFGQLINDTFLVNKTFISKEMASRKKKDFEDLCLATLSQELINVLSANKTPAAKIVRMIEDIISATG